MFHHQSDEESASVDDYLEFDDNDDEDDSEDEDSSTDHRHGSQQGQRKRKIKQEREEVRSVALRLMMRCQRARSPRAQGRERTRN